MMYISDRWCASFREGQKAFDWPSLTEKKVSETALPVICSLGIVLLALLPIPGSTILLSGMVLGAAYLYVPESSEEAVNLPKLKALFSPLAPLRLNIHLSQGNLLPDDAPRGIKDEGGDAWLNADLQLFESSSALTQWLRDCPPQELSVLRDFYQAYYEGNQKLTSGPVRSALSNIFPMDEKGSDPFDFLAFILDICPKELKGVIRKSVFYHTPLHDLNTDLEIKEAEIPVISLQIRGASPNLEKMLHAFYNERPIGLKRAHVGPDNNTHIYRAKKIERRFVTAPSDLWFHILRFENVVQKSIFNEVPFLQSLFPPIEMGISKNISPVSIPHEIEIHPLTGSSKKYRLNAFLVHEGNSPQENRVKVYRYKDDALYGCHNQWIVKVGRLAEQEILSQAYLLHYEPV